jgi:hypothetical protein
LEITRKLSGNKVSLAITKLTIEIDLRFVYAHTTFPLAPPHLFILSSSLSP